MSKYFVGFFPMVVGFNFFFLKYILQHLEMM